MTEGPPPQAKSARDALATVIIVSYNSGEYLERCLSSLMRDARRDYEIIVVDNASTDGTADCVGYRFPDVQVLRNTANLGFGHANNLGAAVARGAYLAFLNPDTEVEPGWLDELVAVLEEHPEAGLATAKILLMADRERINTCGNEIHLTGLTLCRGAGRPRSDLCAAEPVSAVSGAAFAIRRRVFEQLGGFDPAFFMYMEDTDLSWRVRLSGWEILYAPRSVVYHDYALRFGPQKVYYQERNRYLLLLKGLRGGTLAALLAPLLLGEVVTWAFVLLRDPGQWAGKLRAYGWVIGHLPAILRSRRETQRLRHVSDRALLAQSSTALSFEQTGDDAISRLAHAALDPLFARLHRLALAMIRW